MIGGYVVWFIMKIFNWPLISHLTLFLFNNGGMTITDNVDAMMASDLKVYQMEGQDKIEGQRSRGPSTLNLSNTQESGSMMGL